MSDKNTKISKSPVADENELGLLYDLKHCCVLLENLNTNDTNKSPETATFTLRKSVRSKARPSKYENFDLFSPSKQKTKGKGDEELCSSYAGNTLQKNMKSPHLDEIGSATDTVSSLKKTGYNLQITQPSQIKVKERTPEDSESDCQESDFSDSGSDFVPGSDEDESEMSSTEKEENEDSDHDSSKTPKQLMILKADFLKYKPHSPGHVLTPDNYFRMNSSKKNSSAHTLGKVKQFNINYMGSKDTQESEEHENKIKELNKSYERLFLWWFSDLIEGFNLIFYGHGSKRNLLNKFAQEMISDHPYIIVNGFFPSLTMNSILESIIINILRCPCVPSDTTEIINMIEMKLEDDNEHLFVIVHNIDGPALRSAKWQDMLSNLAQLNRLHLLASIDHINASLLWDNLHLSKFKFRWCETNTYLPYSVETSYETSLTQASGGRQLASLQSVYRSLTANAKGIFKIIVQHRLDSQKTPYQGIPFKELYSKSREQFVASSDTALRSQLTEFVDHKIVKMKRTIDGSENVVLLLERNIIQQFVFT